MIKIPFDKKLSLFFFEGNILSSVKICYDKLSFYNDLISLSKLYLFQATFNFLVIEVMNFLDPGNKTQFEV